MLLTFISRIGVLRALLYMCALGLMLASRFTGDEVFYETWRMLPTLIVPSVAPIVFFVLLLDLLMATVFMVDGEGAVRVRFAYIIKVNLLMVLGMIVFWAPYFIALANYAN